MPRGRKPKVDLLLAPKDEEKKVKSPWDRTKGEVPTIVLEKEPSEFSPSVIEKNRQMSKRVEVASIPTNNGLSIRNSVTAKQLEGTLSLCSDEYLYAAAEGSQGTILLYYQRDETDEEVISRLRQKKIELEKLKEELSDENN